ncbi:FAD-dependent oxidoreductase [Nonomuraea sp. NPDC005650]|uniref:FAD-dependent oxidoreductase n=1 Tax=Nonomuraea sp. NPDC005650 TaxID=3157045 RepID=UPI0033BB6BE3
MLIVGAGPSGLMAACELALAGISCRILEQRAEEPNITRAFAVHARALELLDARGLADDLVTRGHAIGRVSPAYASHVDFTRLDSRYPMMLIVPQSGTEHLLESRATELGAQIVRGARVTGLAQDGEAVTVRLQDGSHLRAGYVIGADGAHSTVRDLIGAGFEGDTYTLPMVLADVRIPETAEGSPPINTTGPDGAVIAVPFGDGWFRVGAWLLDGPGQDEPPRFAEIQDAFRRIAGTDYQMSEPRWISRFVTERRQARSYRSGRVFLIGDAAHVNSPMAGQGMNTGLQDAINLGWKLAAAVHGWAPPWLLDTYHAERHPVGAAILAITDRLTRMVLTGSRLQLELGRRAMAAALRTGPGRRRILGLLSGLEISYPPPTPGAHPLTGRRAPDGPTTGGRLYEVLRDGRFVLISSGAAGQAAQPWADRAALIADAPGRPGDSPACPWGRSRTRRRGWQGCRRSA